MHTALQTPTQAKLQHIERWNGWTIVQQVAAKEYGLSEKQFLALLPEYQRFLGLAAQGHHLGMFSSEIDKLWHSHILCTQLYAAFCQEVIERFVHHVPTLSSRQVEICSNIPCKTQCKTPPPCSENCTSAPPPTRSEETQHPGSQTFASLYEEAYGETPPAIWNLPLSDAIATA